MTTTDPTKRTSGYRGALPPRQDRLAKPWIIIVVAIFLLIFVLAALGIPSRFEPEPTPSPSASPSASVEPSGSVEASASEEPSASVEASPSASAAESASPSATP